MSRGPEPRDADPERLDGAGSRAAWSWLERATTWSRAHTWAAILVLLPALAVRLGWPSSISFGGEQIDAIAQAWRAWHEGIPSRGLRVSVGVDMPPLFVWFLMIPVGLTREPILVTAAFAFANLAGLALLGLALRRAMGTRIAWMTVLLVASAPWSVLFSRKIWAQDLILPLHALFLWTLVRWLERRTRARAVVALVALGLLFQIYPGTWFVAGALVAWALAFRVRVPWRDFAIGAAVALVPYIPWIHYQVASGFDGFLLAYSQRGADGVGPEAASWSRSVLDLVALPFHVAGGSRLDLAIGLDAYELWAYSLPTAILIGLEQAAAALAALAFVVASAFVVHRVVRGRRCGPANSGVLVLALCVFEIAAVVAQLGVLKLGATPHYAIVLVLPACVILAWGLDAAARRLAGNRAWPSLALAAAVALLHAATATSLLDFIHTRPEKIYLIYSPPYGHARAALRRDLERAIDTALYAEPRRLVRALEREAVFEESDEVLLRLDPTDPASGFVEVRNLDLAGGADGVAWRTAGPGPWCSVAAFEIPPERKVLLKLDVTSPVDTTFHLFYQRAGLPGWSRRQVVEIPLVAGRSVEYVSLDALDLLPKIGLRVGLYRATIHALEIRAVER